MKLRLDDLQVSSFAADSGTGGGVHANVLTMPADSCACLPDSRLQGCTMQSCGGGQICVTAQFGGGDTCESGPYSYC